MIKCPECGIEYSFGRNLCHLCDNTIIFNGSIFEGPRKEYAWNCSCTEKKVLKVNSVKVPKFLKSEPEEKIPRRWNSQDVINHILPMVVRKCDYLYE